MLTAIRKMLKRKLTNDAKDMSSTLSTHSSSVPSTEHKLIPPTVTNLGPKTDLTYQTCAMVLTENGDRITLSYDANRELTISTHARLLKTPMHKDHKQMMMLPDNKHVVTYTDRLRYAKSGSFTVWNINTAEKVCDVKWPCERIVSIASNNDGKTLFVGDDSNRLTLWNSENQIIHTFELKDSIYSIRTSSLSNELFVAGGIGCYKFKVENNQLKLVGKLETDPCYAIEQLSDGKLIVGSQELTFWDHKKLDKGENGFLARYNPESSHGTHSFSHILQIPMSNLIYACVNSHQNPRSYVYLLDVSDCHHVRMLNQVELNRCFRFEGSCSLTPEGYLLTPCGELVQFDEVSRHYTAMNLQRLSFLNDVAGLPDVLAKITLGFLTHRVNEDKNESKPNDGRPTKKVRS